MRAEQLARSACDADARLSVDDASLGNDLEMIRTGAAAELAQVEALVQALQMKIAAVEAVAQAMRAVAERLERQQTHVSDVESVVSAQPPPPLPDETSDLQIIDDADTAAIHVAAACESIDLDELRRAADELLAKVDRLRGDLRGNEATDRQAEGPADYAVVTDGSAAIDIGGDFRISDEAASAATRPVYTARPRGRKEKSVVRELLGIVLGGAGGLLITYYALNFFGGPRYNFAELYLPGIEHTAQFRPDWWPAWLTWDAPGATRESEGSLDQDADPI
jgi:hypothetical protein